MKSKIVFLILLTASMAMSCQRTDDSKNQIYVIKQDNLLNLSDILIDTLSIPLETNESCLLNDITKVVISDGKLYITDESSNKIFVFKMDGSYFSQIDKLGRGPGEYMEIKDFEVHNQEVFVLSRTNRKIFVYNNFGDFIREYDLGESFNQFCLIGDNSAMLYAERSNNTLFEFSLYSLSTQKMTTQMMPFAQDESYSVQYRPFHRNNETVLITQPYDDQIYELSKDSLIPKYKLQFELGDQYPENHLNMRFEELSLFSKSKDILKWIEYVADFKKSILMVYLSNNKEYGLRQNIAYIDKETGETKGIRLGDAIDEQFPMLSTVIGVSEHLLISYIPPFVYLDRCGAYGLKQNLKVQSTDNPIISIYKIKDK